MVGNMVMVGSILFLVHSILYLVSKIGSGLA